MPITFTDPALQSNESFKSYETADDLGKAYLDLNTRVSGGSIDLLPEELRKDPAISRYKSLPDLAKGLVETQKMVGSFEKAPATPEEYKPTAMNGLHANLKAEGIVKELMPLFHKAGLGNKTADAVQQGLLTILSSKMIQQDEAKKANAMKTETTLRGEWGAEYDARADRLQKTWELAGGKGKVMDSPIENINAMNKLVSFLSEDSLKNLGSGGDKPVTNAAEAQAAVDTYMKEITSTGKSHPYFNDRDPKHEEAVKKMHDLHALMATK